MFGESAQGTGSTGGTRSVEAARRRLGLKVVRESESQLL